MEQNGLYCCHSCDVPAISPVTETTQSFKGKGKCAMLGTSLKALE